MQILETLPLEVKNYIKFEKIKISYLDLDNVFGFLYWKEVFVNKNINFYKKRFNICHELWHHYYWDKCSICNLLWWKDFQERRADDIAMKVLLPKEQLLEEFEKYDWDLSILEKIFWVEMQIIEKRLKQIFNI